ncbi:MAG: hypothetical protein ACI9RO_002282 [Alteromonas macleodii]
MSVIFTLDGKEVLASADETIWKVAKRKGTEFRIYAGKAHRVIALIAIAVAVWSRSMANAF